MFLLLDIELCVCKIHKPVTIQESDLQVAYSVRIKNYGILCNYETNKLPLSMQRE